MQAACLRETFFAGIFAPLLSQGATILFNGIVVAYTIENPNSNHMIDILFSIPIHEKFEVVVDQIINFRHFNPNCGFIFHISKVFDYKNSRLTEDEFVAIVRKVGGVIINPEHLRTGLYDIIQTHISNFRFACRITDFQYFCMSSSNELFVKKGLCSFMSNYDCGVSLQIIETDSKKTKNAKSDTDLIQMTYMNDERNIRYSQIEGTFYKKKLFEKIADVIDEHYDYQQMKVAHAREEVYFSTILYDMIQRGLHVHNTESSYTWMNWENSLLVWISDYNRVVSRMPDKYTIKRVDRDLNDYLRNYIMQESGYTAEEQQYLPFLNLIDRRTIVFQEFEKKLKHYSRNKIISPIKKILSKMKRNKK